MKAGMPPAPQVMAKAQALTHRVWPGPAPQGLLSLCLLSPAQRPASGPEARLRGMPFLLVWFNLLVAMQDVQRLPFTVCHVPADLLSMSQILHLVFIRSP